MHYENLKCRKENIFRIVIYKHEDLSNPGDVDCRLCSVQECRCIRPSTLQSFFRDTELIGYQDEFKDLETEEFYLISFKELDDETLYMTSADKITDDNLNEFLLLHE